MIYILLHLAHTTPSSSYYHLNAGTTFHYMYGTVPSTYNHKRVRTWLLQHFSQPPIMPGLVSSPLTNSYSISNVPQPPIAHPGSCVCGTQNVQSVRIPVSSSNPQPALQSVQYLRSENQTCKSRKCHY